MLRLPLTYRALKRPRVPAPAIALPSTISPSSSRLRLTLLTLALALGGLESHLLLTQAEHERWVQREVALAQTQAHAEEAGVPLQVSAEALAEQAAWQDAFERRQAALAERRSILAQRITEQYQVEPTTASELVLQSERAADEHHVDPILLMAVVGVESRFNPHVVSSAGAVGLTQMIPRAHPTKVQEVRSRGGSLVNPADNLHVGAWILSDYLALNHGNQVRALQAYNGASKDGTARYAKKVLRVYGQLKEQLPKIPAGPDGPPPPLLSLARA